MFNWVCWIAPDNLVSTLHSNLAFNTDLVPDRQPNIRVSIPHSEKRPSHPPFLVSAAASGFLSLPSTGMRLLISAARKLTFAPIPSRVLIIPLGLSRLVRNFLSRSCHSDPRIQGGRKQMSLRDLFYFFVRAFHHPVLYNP